VITGILTYVALFGLVGVWIVGWMGLSIVAGSFFDLPLRTVSLVGATLGPLGLVVTVIIGVLETRPVRDDRSDDAGLGWPTVTDFDDPFAP